MTRRAFVASVVVAVAALASSCTSPNSAGPTPVSTTIASADPTPGGGSRDNALVTRVVDGDTVEARFGGRPLTVRLIGIDTPESVAPDQPVQCFAHQASAYTTERLEGARVRLQFDLERIDPFGRTLAYVWQGDELFNETLVREGTRSSPPTRRTSGTWTGSEPPSARLVRQGEACGAGASGRARAIRHTPTRASRHRRPTWSVRTSTSAGSRCCRPTRTTSTAITTASGAKSREVSCEWRRGASLKFRWNAVGGASRRHCCRSSEPRTCWPRPVHPGHRRGG